MKVIARLCVSWIEGSDPVRVRPTAAADTQTLELRVQGLTDLGIHISEVKGCFPRRANLEFRAETMPRLGVHESSIVSGNDRVFDYAITPINASLVRGTLFVYSRFQSGYPRVAGKNR